MLDIKHIRDNPAYFKQQLTYRKHDDFMVDELLLVYSQRNEMKIKIDKLRNYKSSITQEFHNTNSHELKEKSMQLDNELNNLLSIYQDLSQQYDKYMLTIPNILSDNVPLGMTDSIVYTSKHSNLLKLDNISYMSSPYISSGTELSGSKFMLLEGPLAELERILMDKMIRLNKHIYTEYSVPLIINQEILQACGQLPKFHDDLFQLTNTQYLIPTGEVSLVGMLSSMDLSKMPIRLTTATPCFRAEAGGINDGLIRVHQFYKVELVHACTEEDNQKEFDLLIDNVKRVLDYFDLPYRIVNVCSESIGFHSHQTYDFEVWMPSKNKYVEISSCSMCHTFQSRRSNLKYNKQYPYTLNGSGIAIGRTIAALLENHLIQDRKTIDMKKLSSMIEEYRK